MKKKILFINALLERNTPRSIRTLNFIKHLKDDYEIHVLYFKFLKDKIEISGVTVHTIELKNYFKRKFIASKTKNIFFRLIYNLNDLPNKLKDIFNFDIKNLSRKINQLENDIKFDKIIISIFPFSLYKLVDKIPFDKVSFDIGDHLYKNSAVPVFSKDYYFELEKEALLKSRKIIVTNSDTKLFYIKNFNLVPSKIEIISQGYDEELIENFKKEKKRENKGFIRLVYGGRFYQGLRDPIPLIKAIKKYNSDNPPIKIKFDIYGGAGVRIEEGGGIKIHPSISQKELFREIINSDYNVFIDNRTGIQTPGKIYENLALGTPMLFIKSSNITETFKLVNKCKGIKFVENENTFIFQELHQLKVYDGGIKCNFDIIMYSWKNISYKIVY